VAYGRISPEKGFEYLIWAMQLLNRRRQRRGLNPARLLIFGKLYPNEPGRKAYADRLRQLAGDDPLITLEFDPEGYAGAERLRRLDQSTVGVVPSLYEPF